MYRHVPLFAIDGSVDKSGDYFQATSAAFNWFQVDMAADQEVHRVELQHRADECCVFRETFLEVTKV